MSFSQIEWNFAICQWEQYKQNHNGETCELDQMLCFQKNNNDCQGLSTPPPIQQCHPLQQWPTNHLVLWDHPIYDSVQWCICCSGDVLMHCWLFVQKTCLKFVCGYTLPGKQSRMGVLWYRQHPGWGDWEDGWGECELGLWIGKLKTRKCLAERLKRFICCGFHPLVAPRDNIW